MNAEQVNREKKIKKCRLYPRIQHNGKTVLLHRVLAQKALGRPLTRTEQIHHMNGEASGGTLVICQDRAYHAFLHNRKYALDTTGDKNKRKCTFCKSWDNQDNLIPSIDSSFFHRKCRNKWIRDWRLRGKHGSKSDK